jgi:hypothetical protein
MNWSKVGHTLYLLDGCQKESFGFKNINFREEITEKL